MDWESLGIEAREIERITRSILQMVLGSNFSIPIDIDIVVEKSGYISEIFPCGAILAKFGVSGALCPRKDSLPAIAIDAVEFDVLPARSRFSVGHELAHAVLDIDVYKLNTDYTVKGAVAIQKAISAKYKFIEERANYFARAILMPRDLMHKEVIDMYSQVAAKLNYGYLKICQRVSAILARKFKISAAEAEKRLEEAGLVDCVKKSAEHKQDYLI